MERRQATHLGGDCCLLLGWLVLRCFSQGCQLDSGTSGSPQDGEIFCFGEDWLLPAYRCWIFRSSEQCSILIFGWAGTRFKSFLAMIVRAAICSNVLQLQRYSEECASDRAFAAAGPGLWNSLPSHLKEADSSYNEFRRSLKTFLDRETHGIVWTILIVPFRNNLTYLLSQAGAKCSQLLCSSLYGAW